jgi:xylose isomerase
MPGRFDQDLRFGSFNLKGAFWLVKFLEDVGYQGPRHFDAHAYRTEDYAGVKDFARGCMRTYLILKDKGSRWNADSEIQTLLSEISSNGNGLAKDSAYSQKGASQLLAHVFDKDEILKKRLPYERLDQLTVDLLLGVR